MHIYTYKKTKVIINVYTIKLNVTLSIRISNVIQSNVVLENMCFVYSIDSWAKWKTYMLSPVAPTVVDICTYVLYTPTFRMCSLLYARSTVMCTKRNCPLFAKPHHVSRRVLLTILRPCLRSDSKASPTPAQQQPAQAEAHVARHASNA